MYIGIPYNGNSLDRHVIYIIIILCIYRHQQPFIEGFVDKVINLIIHIVSR